MTEPEQRNTKRESREASGERAQSASSTRPRASASDFEHELREILITEESQTVSKSDEPDSTDADDLLWIDRDEAVLRRGDVTLWKLIPYRGILVLTDQRLVFGRFLPDRLLAGVLDSVSYGIEEIVEIERVQTFGRRLRLRICFETQERMTLTVDDPEDWIASVVQAHERLLDG